MKILSWGLISLIINKNKNTLILRILLFYIMYKVYKKYLLFIQPNIKCYEKIYNFNN